LPQKLLDSLQSATSAITEHLAAFPEALDPALQEFYFDALHFLRLAESFGDHSLFDLTRTTSATPSCAIRNVVPAPFLAPRFELAHSTTLFSATLSPWNYFADLLGMPEDTAWIDVDSPFVASQLKVEVARGISTRYQHRKASLAPIADLMARSTNGARQLPGLLQQLRLPRAGGRHAGPRHPEIPAWRQSRRMSESERAAFLERFTSGRQRHRLRGAGRRLRRRHRPAGRAPDRRLRRHPRPAPGEPGQRTAARAHANMFGAGYDYAYLYPGTAEGGAGGRPRDPHRAGPRHGLADRRPLRAARGAGTAAGLVARRSTRYASSP
jgi:DNA excision repair protein ERCC-2